MRDVTEVALKEFFSNMTRCNPEHKAWLRQEFQSFWGVSIPEEKDFQFRNGQGGLAATVATTNYLNLEDQVLHGDEVPPFIAWLSRHFAAPAPVDAPSRLFSKMGANRICHTVDVPHSHQALTERARDIFDSMVSQLPGHGQLAIIVGEVPRP